MHLDEHQDLSWVHSRPPGPVTGAVLRTALIVMVLAAAVLAVLALTAPDVPTGTVTITAKHPAHVELVERDTLSGPARVNQQVGPVVDYCDRHRRCASLTVSASRFKQLEVGQQLPAERLR